MLHSGKNYSKLNESAEESGVGDGWFGHAGGWVTFKSCQELRAADLTCV